MPKTVLQSRQKFNKMKKTIVLLFASYMSLQNINAQNWLTTGNAGLSGANFIGTTDAAPLLFKVNNRLSGRIDYLSSRACTGFGFQTLKFNTASGNSAFGYLSLPANISGYANTAMGQYSMNKNTSGFSNTAFGSEALRNNQDGYFNTAIGQAALAGSTSYDNTALGRYALVSLTTGNSNTALGSAANLSDGTLSNVTLLGFYTTATASHSVQIGNDAVTSVKAAAGYIIVSDGRFKKNIRKNVPGLEFINALNPVTYNYDIQSLNKFKGIDAKRDVESQTISDAALQEYTESVKQKEKIVYSGFLAQEVEKVAQKTGYDFNGVYKPQNDKDAYGLDYAEFVVPLVKAVQELSKQNDELQKQIDELKTIVLATNNTSAAYQSKKVVTTALKISPNPAKNNFTVSGLKQGDMNYIKVVDINGNVIINITSSNSMETIDITSLSKGMYMVSVSCDGELKSFKLIKE